MRRNKNDPRGNEGNKSSVALLLIDLINDLEFEGGERLAGHVVPLTESIANLKKCAKRAGIPVIYVNDNFGKWQSDLKKLVEYCLTQLSLLKQTLKADCRAGRKKTVHGRMAHPRSFCRGFPYKSRSSSLAASSRFRRDLESFLPARLI